MCGCLESVAFSCLLFIILIHSSHLSSHTAPHLTLPIPHLITAVVQANSEKSSSISAGGSSTTTKGLGAGLAKSPLWALVALLAIPLIACAVCVYVGYRCKRKEKKNVLEGLSAEDPESEMYASKTGTVYSYPPEEKQVIVD